MQSVLGAVGFAGERNPQEPVWVADDLHRDFLYRWYGLVTVFEYGTERGSARARRTLD